MEVKVEKKEALTITILENHLVLLSMQTSMDIGKWVHVYTVI